MSEIQDLWQLLKCSQPYFLFSRKTIHIYFKDERHKFSFYHSKSNLRYMFFLNNFIKKDPRLNMERDCFFKQFDNIKLKYGI